MRARVTNLGRAARGLQTSAGGTAMLEPGASADLDLADHPVHEAWVAAGGVRVDRLAEREAKPDDTPLARPLDKPPARGAGPRGRDG